MRSEPVIAVVGASTLVGREVIEILIQGGIAYSELRCLDSAELEVEGIDSTADDLEIERLNDESFEGVDLAFFCSDASIAAEYASKAIAAGSTVIDASSQYRLDPNVPLVIPELNESLLSSRPKLIASPNNSVVPIGMILRAVNRVAGLERVIVSTYQAVSGAGKGALDELWEQSIAIFNQSEMKQEHFSSQIAFNCIPQIDTFLENGYTKEEMKIVDETRRLLDLPHLPISVTAVRVPVFHSNAATLNIQTKTELTPDQFVKVAEEIQGLELFPAHDVYPMQIDAAGDDAVKVGRIRQDPSVPFGLDMWVVTDNLRKGTALNMVQIAQKLIEN